MGREGLGEASGLSFGEGEDDEGPPGVLRVELRVAPARRHRVIDRVVRGQRWSRVEVARRQKFQKMKSLIEVTDFANKLMTKARRGRIADFRGRLQRDLNELLIPCRSE